MEQIYTLDDFKKMLPITIGLEDCIISYLIKDGNEFIEHYLNKLGITGDDIVDQFKKLYPELII